MVGRSKPQKIIERKPSVNLQNAEYLYVQAKNAELAKALAESKNAYTQVLEERDFLQRELFASNLRNSKLENYIKSIDTAARNCINGIVESSNHATSILQITNSIQHLRALDQSMSLQDSPSNNSSSSPGNSSKTQVVKPMIGGHVIFRPTINLRRVNEISREEIQQLQSSSSRIQNNSLNDSHDDISTNNSNQDNSLTSSSFQCGANTSNVRAFRSHQQQLSTNNEPPAAEDLEEFSNSSSEISNITPPNNELGTVVEEQEDEIEDSLPIENHLNSLTNASSSISIPGNTTQAPLLSGVFRDVRVYLSPMQNVAQYLDPHQNVTKERGGSSRSQKSKPSQSNHSPDNKRGASSENRKFSVDSLPSTSAQNSTAQNNSSLNFNSANNLSDVTYNTSLQNSLLTSTKIYSPKNVLSLKPDSSDYENNLDWTRTNDRLEDTSRNCNTFTEDRSGFNSVSSEKWTATKIGCNDSFCSAKESEISKKSIPISSSKCRSSAADYDPLEGPSTMLDSFEAECSSKIDVLSGLGLTPVNTESDNKSASGILSGPANAVLKRRERTLDKSDSSPAVVAPPKRRRSFKKFDSSTPKMNSVKSTRRPIEKKKILTSNRVAKVVIKRMSLSKQSPKSPERKSGGKLKRRSSESSLQNLKFSPRKRINGGIPALNSSNDSTPEKKVKPVISNGSVRRTQSSPEVTPKNRKRNSTIKKSKKRSKLDRTKIKMERSSSETPVSPCKSARPRRIAQKASLKEPSLRKLLTEAHLK